jgi:hypothetical protein
MVRARARVSGCSFRMRPDQLDPAHPRHGDVDDGDVGLVTGDLEERLGTVRRVADDLHVVLAADQRPQPRSQHGVVVHQQDANLSHGPPPDFLTRLRLRPTRHV